MKAYITKGKFKGMEIEVSQWCNDWFMLDPRKAKLFEEDKLTIMRKPFSPTSVAFTAKDMEYIKNHNNNGQLFNWFEITDLTPTVKTAYGRYFFTFRKRKLEPRQYLTFPQAYLCLKTTGKGGKYVHTYREGGFCLIGADWTTEALIEAMKKYEKTIQLTGERARKSGHGIVFFDDAGAVFVATIEKELKELEKSL